MQRILLIEDNSSWLDLMARILKTAGYQVNRATNLDEALMIVSNKKQDVHLIVFDLVLESTIVEDYYVWLNALIRGMEARNLSIPPVIIITGYDLSKAEIIRGFTNFRGIVYTIFEKTTWNPNEFVECVKDATSNRSSNRVQKKSLLQIFLSALLMTTIVFAVFGILLWIVSQITDPQTQKVVLSTGGALIIVIAIFIVVFTQEVRIQDLLEGISKIWSS